MAHNMNKANQLDIVVKASFPFTMMLLLFTNPFSF